MKKLFLAILSVILATVVVGGGVMAAGGQLNPPFWLIGQNAEMKVVDPFEYTTFWAGGGKDFAFKAGEVVNLYPGSEVAIGEVTISNTSPLPYKIGFYVTPDSIGGDNWPGLNTVLVSGLAEYYSGQIIIAPGRTIKLGIKVTVPYGTTIDPTPFRGLKLFIFPVDPNPPRQYDGLG